MVTDNVLHKYGQAKQEEMGEEDHDINEVQCLSTRGVVIMYHVLYVIMQIARPKCCL